MPISVVDPIQQLEWLLKDEEFNDYFEFDPGVTSQQYIRHGKIVAGCVRPITEGLLALVKSEPDLYDRHPTVYARAGMLDQDSPFSRSAERFVVVFNAEDPGCACHQPPDSDIWGPNGSLGLRAFVLRLWARPVYTDLCLILPCRIGPLGRGQPDIGFTSVDMDLGGKFLQWVYQPSPTPANYLLQTLGIEQRVTHSAHSGSDDLGFPGAEAYLIAELPKLAGYLQAKAEALAAHREKVA